MRMVADRKAIFLSQAASENKLYDESLDLR